MENNKQLTPFTDLATAMFAATHMGNNVRFVRRDDGWFALGESRRSTDGTRWCYVVGQGCMAVRSDEPGWTVW